MTKLLLARILSAKPLHARAALCAALITGISLAVQSPLPAFADSSGVTLSGSQFLLNGQPFVPHGFNSIALLNSAWCTTKSTMAAGNNLNTAELSAAENTWHANTLRFQVSQPVLAGPNGAAYAQQVQSGADLALNAGFAVDISMQDQSLACGPAEPLPSQETEAAWAAIIDNTTLAANPNVMFELFNEPQNSPTDTPTTDPTQETWADWLDGGRQLQPTASEQWSAYAPVGFQDLINYMRSTLNVTNVLIADGASNAEHLEGMPILADPGSSYQVAYAVHPYSYTAGLSAWNARWGYLASTNAVIATEWNYTASDCGKAAATIAPRFLSYMRSTVNVGILGHALDNFGSGNLVANTALAPTKCRTAHPGGGYDFLHSYMNTFLPSPTVPAGLTATPVSGTQISLSWSASTATDNAIAGYDIYRDGTRIATVSGTSYSDTGLASGTTYSYAVDAVDTVGNTSAQTAPVTATTVTATGDTQPPSVPGGLKLAVTAPGIKLTWNASTDNVGVAGYTVYRNGTVLGTASGPAYSDTTVVQGTTYSYAIAALDAAGNVSAKSATRSVAFPDTTRPTQPTKLTLTPATTSIALKWAASTDNVGVSGYRIYRGSTLIATVKGSVTTYQSTGLKANTTYSYHLLAFDAAGNLSPATATVSAKTK